MHIGIAPGLRGAGAVLDHAGRQSYGFAGKHDFSLSFSGLKPRTSM
jgi:hypothetical protein